MRWDLYTSAEKMQVLWVCIGLPVLLLAAWLVRDWMDAGGSKKARKAAKALGSRTDEMEHAISIQAQAVAYRVTQAGIQTCLYYRLLVKGQAAMELCALLVVSVPRIKTGLRIGFGRTTACAAMPCAIKAATPSRTACRKVRRII